MAAVVDLKGLKDNLKSLFDSANTTTASPVDLSNSLTRRVQKVLTVNPDMIPLQLSYFPYVTCYVGGKSNLKDDIAGGQLNSKRRALIDVKVVGMVWNNNHTSDTEDPADNDINYLMENVELILRSNHNITNKVQWQLPDGVEYYSASLDEQTHLRAGVISLNATVFY
jgi:hypothetical protein